MRHERTSEWHLSDSSFDISERNVMAKVVHFGGRSRLGSQFS